MNTMKNETVTKVGLLCIIDRKLLIVYKPSIGQYITPGGKIAPNETDRECLEREIEEELGCKIGSIKFFQSFVNKEAAGKKLVQRCYIGELVGDIKLNPHDTIQDYCWITKDAKEIGNRQLGPMLKEQILPALIEEEYL